MIHLYTDGSCVKKDVKDKTGRGGWGFIAIYPDDISIEDSGGNTDTTNNRMELQAVIEGLRCCSRGDKIVIYTDSNYVLNCGKGLWKRKANTDLWREFDLVRNSKNITWEKVKAHSGNKWNDHVDRLAYNETQK